MNTPSPSGGLRSWIRRTGRTLIRRFWPELCYLDAESDHYTQIANTTRGSEVSPKSRLYAPFHIRDSTIDAHTYVARNAWMSMTRVGKFCSIGPNVTCGGGIHPVDAVSTSPVFYSTRKQTGWSLAESDDFEELRPIEIGHDVFIGANVTILDGVTIGDGAVVGAGCVVSKDVPPYAIVVGCPMRILRYRFDEDTRNRLLAIRWWDWPEEKLPDVQKNFFDVRRFVDICTEQR